VSPNGVSLLDPIDHVEVVDVLFANVVAAKPDEIVPIAHLIFHFGQGAALLLLQVSAELDPRRGPVPITTHGDDVANRAVMQPPEGVEITKLVMALEADGDF